MVGGFELGHRVTLVVAVATGFAACSSSGGSEDGADGRGASAGIGGTGLDASATGGSSGAIGSGGTAAGGGGTAGSSGGAGGTGTGGASGAAGDGGTGGVAGASGVGGTGGAAGVGASAGQGGNAGAAGSSCVASNDCTGIECGSVDDGCGRILDCGACTAPQSCAGDGIPNECGGCTAYGTLGGPAPDTRGGHRVFDSAGYLYFVSFVDGLARVPPGGGTSEPLVTLVDAGYEGMAGTPFVDADDTVLFQGVGAILRYDPSSGMTTTFANAAAANDRFGFGLLQDDRGQLIALRKGQVFDASGTSVGTVSSVDYMVLTDRWIFHVVGTKNFVDRICWDGSLGDHVADGFNDAYGLAIAPDGSMYFGQGNNDPSGIFRVPPGGGPAERIGEVPMAVFGVVIDSSGQHLYVSGSDFHTVWEVETVSGDAVVYGCDARSTYACGATG